MKVLLAINTLTLIDNFVYSNHAQLYYRLGKGLKQEDDVILFHPFRMSIDRMRNMAVKTALDNECDWLFFVDDDVQVPRDAFFRLASHDKDIVAGVTYIRGYPFHPMIFRNKPESEGMDYLDDYTSHVQDDGLIECDAVGFSCVLIKIDLIRKMSSPYCITGANHTEDIYFCQKAIAEVPGTKIYVDPAVQTAHKLGVEFIEKSNIEPMKTYMEALDTKPEESEEGNRKDRSEKYLDENKINLESLESRLRIDKI